MSYKVYNVMSFFGRWLKVTPYSEVPDFFKEIITISTRASCLPCCNLL